MGNDRAGRRTETDSHLAGDYRGEGGLPEPRWTVKEDVIERFPPALRGIDEDTEILPGGLLTDELVQALWAERGVSVLYGTLRRGDPGGVSGHQSCSMPSPTISSQSGLRLPNTEYCGRAKKGSSNVPTGNAICPSDPRSFW